MRVKKAMEKNAASESNKFDDVLGYLQRSVPGFAQVVVLDRRLDVFSRAWWVLEVALWNLCTFRSVMCRHHVTPAHFAWPVLG